MNQRGFDNQPDSEWMSADEVAQRLGVKRATVYAYASRGWLGAHARGPGTPARYARSAVERLRLRAAARAGHGAVAAGALHWGEPVLDTEISAITAEGPSYRGQSAVQLAVGGARFEAVAEELWASGADEPWRPGGALPRWLKLPVPGAADGILRLVLAVGALGLEEPDRFVREPGLELERARGVISRLAMVCGATTSPWLGSIAATALASLRGRPGSPRERRLVEMALVLLADHELNASTFAVRIAASVGADLHAALVAGLGTLAGPAHGGACDRCDALLDEVARADAQSIVRHRLARGESLPGFDVNAYPAGDPRAVALLEALEKDRPNAGDVTRAHALCNAVRRTVGRHPAIDLAVSVMTRSMGLPAGSAGLLFALARTAGWVAHILEQRQTGATLRPRARYVGQVSAR